MSENKNLNDTENKCFFLIETNKLNNCILVNEVNLWWKEHENISNEEISECLNISRNDQNAGFGLDFSEIRRGELLLDSVFKSIDAANIYSVETAVLLLDSIYHTRLQSPLRTAGNIQHLLLQDDVALLDKIKNAEEPKEIVDCVNKIAAVDKKENAADNNIYSFATKFCNRLNPEHFPIFDSYVVGLLYRYNMKDGFTNFTQASLGYYDNFLEVYDKFREKYQLKKFNYKEIDIFMWTYGKILNSKNNKNRKGDIRLYVQFCKPDDAK